MNEKISKYFSSTGRKVTWLGLLTKLNNSELFQADFSKTGKGLFLHLMSFRKNFPVSLRNLKS